MFDRGFDIKLQSNYEKGWVVVPRRYSLDAENWERKPQHLYSVRFTMRELWGEGASERDSVHIDLFDDYLLPG